MSSPAISLSALCKQIKETLSNNLWESVWVVVEISEIRTNSSGHCYLELIEKDEKSDQIIARIKGNIWSYTFRMLRPYFESATGQQLTSGLKILVNGTVEFHEVFGISINIRDIDPTYTLGDLAQRRNLIIKRLREEGVFEMNHDVTQPTVIQRIAIISSPTAAGYEDFVNQLSVNAYGFVFYHKLFPAIVQGDKAEESIINALEQIFSYEHHFDVVALIRGGGSSTDLLCFDSYHIALNIAQFPLPVLTGIGHERDLSICDMVAFAHLKTPTAVAEYIINYNAAFEQNINGYAEVILDLFSERMLEEKELLNHRANRITTLSKKQLALGSSELSVHANQLVNMSRLIFRDNRKQLEKQGEMVALKAKLTVKSSGVKLSYLVKKLRYDTQVSFKQQNVLLQSFCNQNHLYDPAALLEKGYSLTYFNGAILKDLKKIKKGDTITTRLKDGSFESTVNE
jgi:exodeoxyribonuclease VII large subunit